MCNISLRKENYFRKLLYIATFFYVTYPPFSFFDAIFSDPFQRLTILVVKE